MRRKGVVGQGFPIGETEVFEFLSTREKTDAVAPPIRMRWLIRHDHTQLIDLLGQLNRSEEVRAALQPGPM